MTRTGASATAQPLVAVDAVSRTFGRGHTAVVAVHDINCTVAPGARIALTGASGSGKSTLLHLMAGLDLPTSGTVSWPALGGRGDLRPGAVSMVFQRPSLIPALDVVENVALPLVLGGYERAELRAHEALDRLGLGDLSRRLPEELSGGQAQRVAVARALTGEPRLILADEPTGQLDHTVAAEVLDALLSTVEILGAALLVATHDPAVSDRLDDAWPMLDGTLTETRTACSL